jgi:hypothetical protein
MKERINRCIDWFEAKFSFIIDLLALLGGAFCIFLAIYAFIAMIAGAMEALDILEYVLIPGLIGFFGIIVLFALRITRKLTK